MAQASSNSALGKRIIVMVIHRIRSFSYFTESFQYCPWFELSSYYTSSMYPEDYYKQH